MHTVVRILLLIALFSATVLFTSGCENHFDKNNNLPELYSQFEAQQPRNVATSGISERIDQLYERFNSIDQPGCAVGVLRDGRYIHAKGYGSANLEHDLPIDLDTIFRTGSLAKQFTAHAIALLAIREKLDLDADIHTYLPDLYPYPLTVTVRQVIHHVSGMADYGDPSLRFEVKPGKPFRFGNKDYWTEKEFYDNVIKQPLEIPANTRYLYSNLGYFLLGQIVERVSNLTLADFTRQEIFDPLGMNQTFFSKNANQIVPKRATGYQPISNDGFDIFETNLEWVGDGGLYTSLSDMAKWDRAFVSGNVPGGEKVLGLITVPNDLSVKTMQSAFLDDGAGYGFGLEIGTYKTYPVHAHTGAWVGFRALYARFPDQGFSVVTLCNRTDGRSKESIVALLDETLTWFIGTPQP